MTTTKSGREVAKPEQSAVRTAETSVIIRMAEKFGMDPRAFESTVRNTLMPSNVSVSPEHLAAFLLVADQYGLNPFTKELYAFDNKKGGIGIIVPIDGWYRLANDHPAYDGIEFEYHTDDEGRLDAVTARVWRKDRTRPTCATEYMAECVGPTIPWKKWPRRMLRHKAAIQAFRAAFSLSGVVDEDEAERFKDVEAIVREPASPPPLSRGGVASIAHAIGMDPPAAGEESPAAGSPAQDAPPAREPGDDDEQSLGVGGAE